MQSAQSPYVPRRGQKPGLSDLAWLPFYALRGVWELILARIAFASFEARDIIDLNQAAAAFPATDLGCNPALPQRIGYVLPRLSSRLPWRSDCLIQAIAAQRWLSSQGLTSEIQIGVETPPDRDFGAHAWLVHDGEIVTGGDIAQYELLLGKSALAERSDKTVTNKE